MGKKEKCGKDSKHTSSNARRSKRVAKKQSSRIRNIETDDNTLVRRRGNEKEIISRQPAGDTGDKMKLSDVKPLSKAQMKYLRRQVETHYVKELLQLAKERYAISPTEKMKRIIEILEEEERKP